MSPSRSNPSFPSRCFGAKILPGVTGFILAAGKGTRLAPLTDRLPKPLVPFFDVPLIELTVARLLAAGIDHLVVNAYAHSELLQQELGFLRERLPPGGRLDVSVESELMGTGGGIARARRFFPGRTLLVANSDIWFDVDLSALVRRHQEEGNDATLLLESGERHPHLRSTLLGPDGGLVSIEKASVRGREYGLFSGLYVLSPSVIDLLPDEPCSVISRAILPARDRGLRVRGCLETFPWEDLGTFDGFLRGSLSVLDEVFGTAPGASVKDVLHLTPGVFHPQTVEGRRTSVYLGPGVSLPRSPGRLERTALGAGCRLGEGVVLRDCVALPSTEVERDVRASVLAPGFLRD